MTTAPTRLTAQDLWRLGESDVRRELVDGTVIEMSPPGALYGKVTLLLARKLLEHVERQGGGEVLVGVELQRKVRDYLEAGTRLVWVVAPEARTATAYRADGSAQLLTERDSLQGEAVLAGLSVPLGEILPSA